jgi:hypothetical protein
MDLGPTAEILLTEAAIGPQLPDRPAEAGLWLGARGQVG